MRMSEESNWRRRIRDGSDWSRENDDEDVLRFKNQG